MRTWSMLSAVGLSLLVAGGALARGTGPDGQPTSGIHEYSVAVPDAISSQPPQPPPKGQVLPFQDADGEELDAIERSCLTPRWGESDEPCAAFALAVGASVEIVLKEVKDNGTDDTGTKIIFRLYDVKGRVSVDTSNPIAVGGKYTYTNNTSAALDLVVRAKNDTTISKRDIRFTYEKK